MNYLQPLFIREQLIKSIRSFFYAQNFHEVITPTLNEAIPNEPNIYPFTTIWKTNHGKKTYYLSTSPEQSLKLMLAKGIGNCFAISKSFRNLEDSGSQHIPEFLMLEWYRENANYLDIMKDVKNLIVSINQLIDTYSIPTKPWEQISLADLFENITQIPFNQLLKDGSLLFNYAKSKKYSVTASWEELYNQIFVQEIESKFPKEPFFLIDFPSKFSPLCKPKKENPLLAERFELYIGKMEIANGNTENTDYQSIKKSFMMEEEVRKNKGIQYSPVDTTFLDSLKAMSKRTYAGIGLGIDRLTMLFSDLNNLSTLWFTPRSSKSEVGTL